MTARSGLFVAPTSGVGAAPIDARLALSGVLGAVPQCVQGGAITQSGTTMQFTIGQSVMQLPDPTNGAASFVSAIDQTVVTPAAGPGTGSRIDLIVAKQNNPENGDADSRASFSLIAGTAGAPGVAPSVPAGYFRYADINVPALASNAAACTVTLRSPTTFAPVDLVAPTYALLSTVTGSLGQHATVTNDTTAANNGDYFWNGSTWPKAVGATIGGSVKRSASAVTFTSGAWTALTNTTYWQTDQPPLGFAAFAGTWVAPIAGLYDIRVGLQLNTTESPILCLKKNDTSASSTGNIATMSTAGSANDTGVQVSKIERLNAGDYVAAAVYNSAAAIWDTANPDGSFFSIRYLEPLR